MKMNMMTKLLLVNMIEYGVTTTVAWRWILGADFPWWKPFVIGMLSCAFLVLRVAIFHKKEDVK